VASFINLGWIVFSFIFTNQTTFLLTIAGFISLLGWQFLFVYGARVPVIKDTYLFTSIGSYFKFKMSAPVTE
jgi:hypothetical protein